MPLRNWQEMIEEAEKSGPIERKPVDPGEYDLIIEKAEYRPSKSGKDGYNIHAKVETGPSAGQRVFETFYVSPESPTAMSIFFRQMNVLGLDKAFWATNPSDDQICAALVGKRFIGTVGHRENGGKTYTTLKNVATPRPLAAGAGPAAPGAAPTPMPVVPSPATSPAPMPSVQAPAASAAPASMPTVPAAPTPPAATPAAAPASPWDATASAQPVAANDPWAATPPPAPPVPGA